VLSTGMVSSTSVELIAIHQALFHSLTQGSNATRETAFILTDSKGALQALRSLSPASPNANIVQGILALLERRGATHAQWIPSHVGIDGNEKADKLAGDGIGKTMAMCHLSQNVTALKKMFKVEAQRHWNRLYSTRAAQTKRVQWGMEICLKGPPLTSSERAVAVTTHRLRCGKALTASTLLQIKASDTDLCAVCSIREDAFHILEECQAFAAQREVCTQIHSKQGWMRKYHGAWLGSCRTRESRCEEIYEQMI